jgi:hypothetical protein
LRLHYWMLGGFIVLCGMFIFRRVTATYIATFCTKAQVNPIITKLEALFALFFFGAGDFYSVKVLALTQC